MGGKRFSDRADCVDGIRPDRLMRTHVSEPDIGAEERCATLIYVDAHGWCAGPLLVERYGSCQMLALFSFESVRSIRCWREK